jgi:hypothetical protein
MHPAYGQQCDTHPYGATQPPAPLERRVRPSAGGDALHAGYEYFTFDPEDEPGAENPAPEPVKRRRIRQLAH